MIMTVFAGIAQFERSLILSRTAEGRKAAMVRGVTFGRPKKMRPDQAELARQLVLEGKSISSVARHFNVHPANIYRLIELKCIFIHFSVPSNRTTSTFGRPHF